MSPAAVHFQSPIHSSSVQNPDSVPDATSHSFNFPSFGNANGESLNPPTFCDSSGCGLPPSMRSKPRLVKLRKQSASQYARSRSRTATPTAAGDVGSGFNPFRSASVNSDQVTGNVIASNGLIGGSSGVESGAGTCDGSYSTNCHLKFGTTGFVFSARRTNYASDRDLNSEQGAAAGCREESCGYVSRGEGTTEKETEFRKSDHVEFVFSAKQIDVESNSLPVTSENAANTVSCDERKIKLSSELERGDFNSTGFVFNADQNTMASNFNTEKGGSSECVETSGISDGGERKCKTEVECERGDSVSFVFGENHSSKTSNFETEKVESLDGMRKWDHGFGSFCTKTETIRNGNTEAGQCDHLGNNCKCKSGYGSTNGICSAYSTIPAYELPDEMKKLNIGPSENVFSGADGTRVSKNSHVKNSASFVFGRSEKVLGSFSFSSGTDADGQQSCNSAFFEKIGGQNFKTSETNVVQNGTGCRNASGFTGIPCSKASTSQEGIRECHVPEDSQVNGDSAQFLSSLFSLNSHSKYFASTGHSLYANHDKHDNGFTSIPEASKQSFMDFKPPTWDPSSFKENLFPKLNKKLESTQKSRSSKGKGSNRMRTKLKPHALNDKQTRVDHLSKESSSHENQQSPGSHSPMDFSPYTETGVDDQDVKASEELNELQSTIYTAYKDENLATLGRGIDVNITDHGCGDPEKDKLSSHNGSSSVGDFHSSGPEIVWPNLKTEQFKSSFTGGALADAGIDFSLNIEKQKTGLFSFVHGLDDSKEKDFAFSASSIGAATSSSSKHKLKKKFRRKTGCDSSVISPNLNGKCESSSQFSPLTTSNMSSNSDVLGRSEINNQFKDSDVTSSATMQETCNNWRLRGNQAYKDGDLSKAEDFYTLGINSVPSSETSAGCMVRPLSLCYSNRAATRMSLRRIREALGDCLMATSLDPTFLKVQMRTANCHLLLGEVDNAQQRFNNCLESVNVVCLDRRVIVEAAEGLQKAQTVVDCMNNAAELLKKRTPEAAGNALELLTNAMSISLYSEKLLQMKAEALFLLVLLLV